MTEQGSHSHANRPFHDCGLYLILGLALLLRTFHLAYPPWDYHNWRQAQTLNLARDFARRNFRILNPQVQWVSGERPSDPSYYTGEFSLESILAAGLYKVFGESNTLARVVVIAFSLLGVFFLYTLLERRAGRKAARLGAFVYALLPYHLYFGRVFMPDVPALTMALGGLDYLDRWTEDRRWRTLLAAATLTALALLQKLTVAFVGLSALYLFWLTLRGGLLKRLEPYVFGTIAGLPALAWYTHAAALAKVSGFRILPTGDLGRHLGRWFEAPFAFEMFRKLASETFSPLGLALAIGGLIWAGRNRAAGVFRLWVIGALAVLGLFPEVVAENAYYLTLLLPGGAALAGLLLERTTQDRRAYPLLGLLLTLLAAESVVCAYPFYHEDRVVRDQGVLLHNLTASQDLIVTESGGSPMVLYFADRRGWMVRGAYDLKLIDRLAQSGARYYADVFLTERTRHAEFFRAMDERFERLTPEDGPWPVYSLFPPPGPLREAPAGAIQDPHRVNFDNRIDLLGISTRELLEWPTSVEMTYYWRCQKKVDRNLSVFVHFTNSEGRILFQQDHLPLSGRLPTSRWNPGEVIRERYVVVLPGELPAGPYQIRVGWFDPVTGPRLPIIPPSASDGQDRAIAGKIQVRHAPRFRWFSVDN